jgi:hypothetical protein
MKTGIELIAEERNRQIEMEGFTTSHDEKETNGQLAIAAANYALPHEERQLDNTFVGVPLNWPWEKSWWKPTPENRIRELQKAGALIAAEIDRLNKNKTL